MLGLFICYVFSPPLVAASALAVSLEPLSPEGAQASEATNFFGCMQPKKIYIISRQVTGDGID